MKIRIVTAIILILSTGQFCTGQEIHLEADNLYSTRKLLSTASMGMGNSIVIRSASALRGNLTITASDTNEISLTYYKKARAEPKSSAVDYIDLIAVDLNTIPEGGRLEMRAPNPPPWENGDYGMVEAELIVPESCTVDIDAVYFDVEATGPFKALVNTTSLGRLNVTDVTARLDLSTANRRVTVEKISSDISISTSNSTLVARDITSLTESAYFRNNGGDLLIDGFIGGINAKNSYGRIDITNFQPYGSKSYVRCTSGPIMINITKMSDGQLLVNNRYEDIELMIPIDLSAVVSLAVDDGGRIEADDFLFETELVEPNRLNLITGNGDGLISGSIRGKGNIYVRGTDEGE